MRVHYCLILAILCILIGFRAPGHGAEEPGPQYRFVPWNERASANSQETSSGITTGYDGHYACRSFSGIDRKLAIAVSDQEPMVVAELLRAGADINARSNGSPTRGMTLLHTAVWHPWGIESIQLMIESGAETEARDANGNTSLILACQSAPLSNLPVVATLVRAGADVNARGAKGMTPLMHAAIQAETTQVLRLLLDASADVTARDDQGWTALMHATGRRREHIATVHMLAAAGSEVAAAHKYGGTSLSNAAYNGHLQTVRFLIKAGANVNTSDAAKWTPLICSAINGHYDIAKLLLQSGANVNAIDRLGRAPLTVARLNGHRSVEQLLLEAGARQ